MVADARDSRSVPHAHRADLAGRVLAANTAHGSFPAARATVLPRRAIRIGVAGLVDAGRVTRVARGADAIELDALPLRRRVVKALGANAVELTEVVARHRAGARRIQRDVRVGGRA